MRQLPLSGVRVADFTWIGAGSFTTKMLADMGAEVIKIESSLSVDSLRITGPFKDGVPGINRSGYFADRNTSKKSITINLKEPLGRELAMALIDRSHIVANNFTPGTMEKFGLGADTLLARKPDLIYLGMTLQGDDGPERMSIGYGLTIGALVGLQHLTGLPGREPAGTGTNYPDHIPNPCHGAFAVLAAWRHRRRTGQGQRIEMAQTEATLALLAPAIMNSAVNGQHTGPQGNRSDAAAPQGVYPCAGDDRWVAISVESDGQWRALGDVLQEPALLRSAWRDAAARRQAHDEIDQALAQATRGVAAEELMDRLQAAGVPAAVVQTARDVVENDPQLSHRAHWRRFDHPEMGRSVYNSPPYRFASLEVGPLTRAPLFGEHTEALCREVLGLQPAEIAQLVAGGVLK